MKIRISKNKKGYEIIVFKKNQVIDTYQTSRIEQFTLQTDIIGKIKKVELTLDIILIHRVVYPIMNKNKILKQHFQKFKEIKNGKECYIIKNIFTRLKSNIECITYYIQNDIIEFIYNNKLNKNKLSIYKDNKIFDNKKHCQLIMDDYGIVLVINKLVKYHYNKSFKQLINVENLICSLLFVNVEIKRLNVLIQKNIEHEYTTFLKHLYDHVEERVHIIVEKI